MKRWVCCAEKIQSRAKACRFCQHSQPAVEGSGRLLLVCLGIIVFLGIVGSGSRPSPPKASSPKAQATVATSKGGAANSLQVRVLALRKLEGAMRDPSSMQTRNLRVPPGSAYLCGEVNGRNAFGGMTGYQRFIVGAAAAMPAVIEGDGSMPPGEFQRAWEQLC